MAFAFFHAATVQLGFLVYPGGISEIAIWPAYGVALGGALSIRSVPRHHVLMTAGVSTWLIEVLNGLDNHVAFGFAVTGVTGAAIVVRLVDARGLRDPLDDILRRPMRLIAGAAVAAPVTALAGWAVIGELSGMSVGYHLLWRTMANFLGFIVFGPAVIALFHANARSGIAKVVSAVASAGVVLVLFAVSGSVDVPTLYLAFPVSMLAAAYIGGRMNHVTVAALLVGLAYMTDRGIGPYSDTGLGNLIQFQVFAVALLLSTTMMAKVHRQVSISAERTRQLLNATGSGVLMMDEDGRIEYANRAARAAFGSDVVGRSIRQLWEGDDDPLAITSAEILHRDVPYDVTLDSFATDEGTSSVMVMRDLSDRYTLERERRNLLHVVESSPDFVGFASTTGEVLYVSPGGRRMVGLASDAPVALEIGAFHPPWAQAVLHEIAVPHAIEHGQWRGELAFVGSDGIEIPVVQIVMAHRNDRGELEMLSTIAHDVRDRVEAERQRQDIIDSTVHDLRNTLVAIGGATEMLQADIDSDLALEPALVEILSRGVEQLEELIEDLTVTRSMDGRATLDAERLDLSALARQVVSLHVIGASRQAVSIRVEGDAVEVLGDRTQLHRLIENLVSNAVKFSPGGGTVSLTVEQVPSAAVLTVRDEGMGIDPGDIEHVFAPRHRSPSVLAAGISGSGLGLAICKQIVDSHGGVIDVLSRPGVGSTFRVELPSIVPAGTVTSSGAI